MNPYVETQHFARRNIMMSAEFEIDRQNSAKITKITNITKINGTQLA